VTRRGEAAPGAWERRGSVSRPPSVGPLVAGGFGVVAFSGGTVVEGGTGVSGRWDPPLSPRVRSCRPLRLGNLPAGKKNADLGGGFCSVWLFLFVWFGFLFALFVWFFVVFLFFSHFLFFLKKKREERMTSFRQG